MPRVLLVDDQPANRTLLRAYLAHSQVEVLEAESGERALELFAREEVDLVLLDVLMPGLDGFEVCRRLKAGMTSFVPVILLTGLTDQADRNAGLEAGADDFLSKPVDRRELALRVRAFLRLRQQEAQILAQEAQLRRQVTEMVQLQGLKDELFALIVHDIRNPLTGMVGFVDLLQEALAGRKDPLARHAEQALKAASRVEELLQSVLEVQMLESGAVELQLARVHIRALVEDAIQSLAGAARATEVDVGLTPGDEVEAQVDQRLVRRSVENLIANAIKYSPRRGMVEVSVRPSESAVEVAVADQGPGVPDQLKTVLFQKFGSVEASSGLTRRGHGLGLHLVKLVASAHNGSVDARDREVGGTKFVLRLEGLSV